MVDSKNIVVAVDQAVHPIIYDVHQGEQGAREFKVQFSAGGVVLQLTQYDVVTVTITIDGTVVSNIKTYVALSHNFVRFILDKSATSKSGIAEMRLVITHQDSEYSDIKILNSAVVRLRIYPMSINNDSESDKVNLEPISKPEAVQSYRMDYVTVKKSLSGNEVFTVRANDIAPSSTVKIKILSTGGNSSVLVKADGTELTDLYTNRVIDASMSNVSISVDEIVNGIKMTQGGTITVSYYNANCEDLLQMINGNSSYAILRATHNLVETDTNYEILPKSEVEI